MKQKKQDLFLLDPNLDPPFRNALDQDPHAVKSTLDLNSSCKKSGSNSFMAL
jgi:hypothetical protein